MTMAVEIASVILALRIDGRPIQLSKRVVRPSRSRPMKLASGAGSQLSSTDIRVIDSTNAITTPRAAR